MSGVVLYDHLLVRGGAEHVSLALTRGLPDAELCVGQRRRAAFDDAALADIRWRTLGPEAHVHGLHMLQSAFRFHQRADLVSRHDWALFSGALTPLALRHRHRGRNVLYCHSLPRFIYDMREDYRVATPAWKRPALRALISWLQPRYEDAVSRMDTIVTNSHTVRRRLSRYLGLEATVVYPPCDLDRFTWRPSEGYYLSTARLEPYKRVERIVDAFLYMPEQRLVVASGGSALENLQRRASGARNIEFTGFVDDTELAYLIAGAIATIYVPKEEDFGLSPVESMAAGKPVIGANEGGVRESLIDGETGLLIGPDPGADDIASAVHTLTSQCAAAMRRACEMRAADFGADVCLSAMRAILRVS